MGDEIETIDRRGEQMISKFYFFHTAVFVLGSLFLAPCLKVQAGTANVEKDNEAIVASPTPENDTAETLMSAETSADPEDEKTEPAVEKNNSSSEDRVNFSYFLTSGYAANDIRNIPNVGKVEGTPELDGSLSVAKSVYVTISDDTVQVKLGSKLIVFGDGGSLTVKKAGFYKQFIKNLAILRVREQLGKRRYLADVITSYDFIPAGAPVKLYDGEKALWEKAQISKPMPDHSIKCYVAGGERGRDAWNQYDYIILTNGTKQGVVEGLYFQLFEPTYGPDNHKEQEPRGWAKVFYAGANYSLARIKTGSDSIQSGFEAISKP
jgi:hypothetical protein